MIRMAFLGVLCATALAIAPLAVFAGEGSKDKLSEDTIKAIQLLNSGDKEGALAKFEKIIKNPKSKPVDLYMTGEFCFTKLGKHDLAVTAFEKALKAGKKCREELGEKDYAMLHDAMGICYAITGKLDKAEKILLEGKKLAKALESYDRWMCEYNLACVFSEGKKKEKAMIELKEHLEGMRLDRWEIDVEKIAGDSSFKSMADSDDFKSLLEDYSKVKGDPAKDAIVRIPAFGRQVEVLLPETTVFKREKMPDYCIRSGSAEGTLFMISLNHNSNSGFKTLKELAQSVYEKTSAGYPEDGKRFIDKGESFILRLKLSMGRLGQLSLRAYYQDKDLFLDLHISAMNPKPEDEERMMRMAESLKFVKTAGK